MFWKQSRISRTGVCVEFFPCPTHRAGLIIFLFICLHLMVAGHLFGWVPRGLITLPRVSGEPRQAENQAENSSNCWSDKGIFLGYLQLLRLLGGSGCSSKAAPATFLFIPLKLSQQEIKVVQSKKFGVTLRSRIQALCGLIEDWGLFGQSWGWMFMVRCS